MIGHVIMEIEPDEMKAALAYYFNRELFTSDMGRLRHKAVITDVRERSNGNFIVEFDGWRPAEPVTEAKESSDVQIES